MDARGKRLAENEVRFRALNERLSSGSIDWAGLEGTLDLVCECSNEDCVSGLQIGLDDYERVRAEPTQFIVVRGHEKPEIEDVVDELEQWSLVRKRGSAGDIARETDPRA